MPDDNKFKRLREIGYNIPVTCQLCIHGDFSSISIWGKCLKHRYKHLRQNNPDGGRGVSIVVSGTCESAEMDSGWKSQLGAHIEFLVNHER